MSAQFQQTVQQWEEYELALREEQAAKLEEQRLAKLEEKWPSLKTWPGKPVPETPF